MIVIRRALIFGRCRCMVFQNHESPGLETDWMDSSRPISDSSFGPHEQEPKQEYKREHDHQA
jgi:hypothetical protein